MATKQQEREAFEAWARANRLNLECETTEQRAAWLAWQARAALAATPATAPQGWKLVSVEPTPEMLWSLFGSFVGQLTAGERKRYAAMLAATPPAAAAPLTDEQIDKTAKRVIPVAAYMGMFEYAAFSKEDADRTVRHFARAIEAAHGIGASTKESNQ